MVINGLTSSKERKMESIRLMNLAFRTFKKYNLLEADKVVEDAPIWMGVEETVPLVSAVDVSRVLTRKVHNNITKRIDFSKEIKAPVTKGQELGQIYITVDGVEKSYPLIAGKDIGATQFINVLGPSLNF